MISCLQSLVKEAISRLLLSGGPDFRLVMPSYHIRFTQVRVAAMSKHRTSSQQSKRRCAPHMLRGVNDASLEFSDVRRVSLTTWCFKWWLCKYR